MLPNNIVWTYEEGEISLIKDYDKLLITMIYLDTHINNIGQCCFTLDDLIVKSGFITRTGKNNSVEQFKNTLIYLQNLGWLDSALDINNLKPKEFVCCTYQTTFKHDDSDNDTCYFKLYYEDIVNRIKNITTRGIAAKQGYSLNDLYKERTPLYENYADITIECTGKSAEELVSCIIDSVHDI
jgi:hypothetical protein